MTTPATCSSEISNECHVSACLMGKKLNAERFPLFTIQYSKLKRVREPLCCTSKKETVTQPYLKTHVTCNCIVMNYKTQGKLQ